MKVFFYVWPFWVAMILGINIWTDANAGRSFNWTNFLGGIGVAAGGGVAFLWCWFVLRIVRGIATAMERRR